MDFNRGKQDVIQILPVRISRVTPVPLKVIWREEQLRAEAGQPQAVMEILGEVRLRPQVHGTVRAAQ
jgi:hypothetical protein